MTNSERVFIATLQLRALSAQGWSVEDCAQRLGWHKDAVRRLRDGRAQRITRARAEQLNKLYERIGPQWREGYAAVRLQKAAERRGWNGSAILLDNVLRRLQF